MTWLPFALAGAVAAMRFFGRTVGIGSLFENHFLLAVISDVKLAGHQHHALRRGVPMQGERGFTRHLEEDVHVVLRRIAVKHGNGAAFGQERRARPPFEAGVIGGQCHRRFCHWRFGTGERTDKHEQRCKDQRQSLQCLFQQRVGCN